MNTFTSLRVIAGVLLLTAVFFAGVVLVPLTFAILISILLDPIVVKASNRGIHRGIASFFTTFGFIVLLTAAGFGVYSVSYRAMESSPVYLTQIRKIARVINLQTASLQHQTGALENSNSLQPDVQKVQVIEGVGSWYSVALRMVGSVFESVSIALFVPLLVFYFLTDKSNLLESFNTLAGRVFYLPKLHSDLPRMIRAFVIGNLIGGLILVGLNLILFFALGLHHAFGLACVSGFLNLIPLFGAPLAMILPLGQALVEWTVPLPFLILVLGLVGFHFIVGNVVLPQIIGPRINVNSASLVLGLLFWGWMWGAMGFLLAIPLTATLKILLESNKNTVPIANLLAVKPRMVFARSQKKAE